MNDEHGLDVFRMDKWPGIQAKRTMRWISPPGSQLEIAQDILQQSQAPLTRMPTINTAIKKYGVRSETYINSHL